MQINDIKRMAKEGRKRLEIERELHEIYGEQAYKRSAIYKYIQETKFGCPEEEESNNEPNYNENRIDEQLLISIQKEVEKEGLYSVRSLAWKVKAPPSVVHRYLRNYLNYIFRPTRYVPHLLDSSQKMERIKKANELFEVLTKSKHNAYRDIITGDQSWFAYNYAPSGGWVQEGEGPPIFVDDQISYEKIMITVIWGVHGTYIIDDLPEGEHFNSNYFVENILLPLQAQNNKIWPSRGNHKIWLHLDNCKIHNSIHTQTEISKTVFKRAPHPPYSPDIAPSDFFLFGYVKEKLSGKCYHEREDLFEEICSIIASIPYQMKVDTFDHWAFRCKWVSTNNGEYFPS